MIVPISAFLIAMTPSTSSAQIQNPLKGVGNITGLVSSMMVYVTRIGGVIAIFAFIYSGFLFVKAQGNPEGLKTAKTVFKNTVIGVAILLGAQLIASIVVGTIKSVGK
ncbi:MAG: hypothetical protein WC915_04540 [archaeon]